MSQSENKNQVFGINFILSFLSGGIANGINKTVFAPIERV